MPAAALDDPILKRFRPALDALFGDRIERVVLYGSRVRGDVHADSDYGIAMFRHDLVNRWKEADRIVERPTDILMDTGAATQIAATLAEQERPT